MLVLGSVPLFFDGGGGLEAGEEAVLGLDFAAKAGLLAADGFEGGVGGEEVAFGDGSEEESVGGVLFTEFSGGGALDVEHGKLEGSGFLGEGAGVAPFGDGDALDAAVLEGVGGGEGGDQVGEKGLEVGVGFTGKDEGVGGSAVFEGIEADGGFAFGGEGTAGKGSVAAGGFLLGGGASGVLSRVFHAPVG